ncbi:MAG: 30S ribosomal protein S3 [Omnitrophica bacterium RIFCSPLOWO2_01_FULL_45_10]|nr:MAG: 30S ribosomal protein S3 [Omnitrophica bacterium RIFCSPLOWO2_01_FULL_45_10]
MGQKAHPYGLRVGYIYDWKSRWFSKKDNFPKLLLEDFKIRKFIKKTLSSAAVSKIEIERSSDRTRIIIYSARPALVIGRRGTEIEKLKEELQSMIGKEVLVDIKEIKNANLDAQLISENICLQLEKRIPHRRTMKRAIQNAMDSGAKGAKIICAGRLGGAEIARDDGLRVGSIPAQTLRADIDYGFAEALTTYGLIGVKVWIYKGDKVLDKTSEEPTKDTKH